MRICTRARAKRGAEGDLFHCHKYVTSQNRGNSPYSPHNSPNANCSFGRIFTEPVSDFPEKTPATYCHLVENSFPRAFLILITTSVLFRCSR